MIRRGLPIALLATLSASASAAPPAVPEDERRSLDERQGEGPGMREPARLVWEPGWRRFGWANAAVIGAGAAAIGAAFLVGPDRDSSDTTAGAVDEDFRRWARPEDRGTRRAFRHASDAFLAVNLVNAYVIDALLNAGWYRDSFDVAFQLAAIDTQVLVVATAVQLWTANLVSRERPYARLCGTELSAEDSDCTSDYRYRSFYSGHTSFSFALATATCTHHAHVPLYAGGASWVPCAAGLTFAAATGASRILADQHYLSDVLVGAAAGGAIGWVIPWLHYVSGERPRARSKGRERPLAGSKGRERALAPSENEVRLAVVPFGRGVAVVGTLP